MRPKRTHTATTHTAVLALIAAGALTGCDRDGDGVRNRLDCAPNEAAAYGGAAEICDNIDNDCDGVIDESDDGAGSWGFVDRDGDGRPGDRVFRCPRYLESRTSEDCNEFDPTVFVGQRETCNGKDDDCDGFADVDMQGLVLYWPDRDGDGFGDATGEPTCNPAGAVSRRPGDCNDLEADVRPDTGETCDGIDNNCDGLIDNVGGGCP